MVLSFENRAIQESYKQYFLQDIEIKDYNIMIDGRNFFDQPVKTDLRTYDIIRNILTGQGDYPYFKKKLKANWNRFTWTAKITCWSKGNTINCFYWKSRSGWQYKNVFHY